MERMKTAIEKDMREKILEEIVNGNLQITTIQGDENVTKKKKKRK